MYRYRQSHTFEGIFPEFVSTIADTYCGSALDSQMKSNYIFI